MSPRKGAVRISEIPPPVLEALCRGEIESVNLVEWLATDLNAVFEGLFGRAAPFSRELSQLKKLAAMGHWVAEHAPDQMQELARHPSDLVRGALPYAVMALRPEISD